MSLNIRRARPGDVGFAGLHLVQQLLVFGKLANQRMDEPGFIGARAADCQRHP